MLNYHDDKEEKCLRCMLILIHIISKTNTDRTKKYSLNKLRAIYIRSYIYIYDILRFQAVLMTGAELGVEFELRILDLINLEHLKPEFVQVCFK